jgi:hypothetical protein
MENTTKEIKLRSNRPACLHLGCQRDTYGGSRGLCLNHYAVKQALVKRGRTTWDKLESEGLVKPKLTRVENALIRSKCSEKLMRVWSEESKSFVFIKR